MKQQKTPGEADAEVRPEPAEKTPNEPTTPEYWARKLGHVAKKASPLDVNGKRRPLHFDAAHAAADQLHGWSLHKQHTTEPLVLSQSDYEAALSAALSPKGRHYVPHTGALSKFAKKRAEERAKRRAERLKSTKGGE